MTASEHLRKIAEESDAKSERILGAVLIALVCLLWIAGGCNPKPIPTPSPAVIAVDGDCPQDRGIMMQVPGVIYGVSDCYVCGKVQSCFDEGNHWCCRDQFCSECAQSPVNFGGKRPVDGGHDQPSGVSR